MADAIVPVDEAVRDGIVRRAVGIAAFDGKGRILLLRQAPGNALPGLWEMPSRQVDDGESPEHAAERELREAGLADADATYAGHFD